MRLIKKYANRKLYDTTAKKYISQTRLAELIKSGEEITVIDNPTGEDITTSIVSQLLAKDQPDRESPIPSRHLFQLLRKGSGTLVDYARKYSTLWQSAFTLADDELDKLVGHLVKDKELSEKEGSRLKGEVQEYARNLKDWMVDMIDQRVSDVLGMMNLATREQVSQLNERIEELTQKISQLEKGHTKK